MKTYSTPVLIPDRVLEEAAVAARRAGVPLAQWITLAVKDRLRQGSA